MDERNEKIDTRNSAINISQLKLCRTEPRRRGLYFASLQPAKAHIKRHKTVSSPGSARGGEDERLGIVKRCDETERVFSRTVEKSAYTQSTQTKTTKSCTNSEGSFFRFSSYVREWKHLRRQPVWHQVTPRVSYASTISSQFNPASADVVVSIR